MDRELAIGFRFENLATIPKNNLGSLWYIVSNVGGHRPGPRRDVLWRLAYFCYCRRLQRTTRDKGYSASRKEGRLGLGHFWDGSRPDEATSRAVIKLCD